MSIRTGSCQVEGQRAGMKGRNSELRLFFPIFLAGVLAGETMKRRVVAMPPETKFLAQHVYLTPSPIFDDSPVGEDRGNYEDMGWAPCGGGRLAWWTS